MNFDIFIKNNHTNSNISTDFNPESVNKLSERDKLLLITSHASRKIISQDHAQSLIQSNEGLSKLIKSETAYQTDNILNGITENATSIITSLGNDLYSISENLEQAIIESTTKLENKLDKIQNEMSALNFNLKEVLKAVSNPAQIWAYEQYDIALDAFRRNHHEDALSSVKRAINGYGDHTGYKMDGRFHHLLGMINLEYAKQNANQSSWIEAESSFLYASKYFENIKLKSLSYLNAAISAFMGDNPARCIEIAKTITKNNELYPQFQYYIAKSEIRINNFKNATESIINCINYGGGRYLINIISSDEFKCCWVDLIEFSKKYKEPSSAHAPVISYVISLSLLLKGEIEAALEHLYQAHRLGGASYLIKAISDNTFLAVGSQFVNFISSLVEKNAITFCINKKDAENAHICHLIANFLKNNNLGVSSQKMLEKAYRINGEEYIIWAIKNEIALELSDEFQKLLLINIENRDLINKIERNTKKCDIFYDISKYLNKINHHNAALEMLDMAFKHGDGSYLDRSAKEFEKNDPENRINGYILRKLTIEIEKIRKSIKFYTEINTDMLEICDEYYNESHFMAFLSEIQKKYKCDSFGDAARQTNLLNKLYEDIGGEIYRCKTCFKKRIDELNSLSSIKFKETEKTIETTKENIKITSIIIGLGISIIFYIVSIVSSNGIAEKIGAIIWGIPTGAIFWAMLSLAIFLILRLFYHFFKLTPQKASELIELEIENVQAKILKLDQIYNKLPQKYMVSGSNS